MPDNYGRLFTASDLDEGDCLALQKPARRSLRQAVSELPSVLAARLSRLGPPLWPNMRVGLYLRPECRRMAVQQTETDRHPQHHTTRPQLDLPEPASRRSWRPRRWWTAGHVRHRASNHAWALDLRTGKQIWHYSKTPPKRLDLLRRGEPRFAIPGNRLSK